MPLRPALGRLSSCLWNLGFFSERCTEKLPLRVDFIHRVELGEVSGHRVLIEIVRDDIKVQEDRRCGFVNFDMSIWTKGGQDDR